LQQLIEELLAETRFQLSAPSISVGSESKKRNLYMRNPRVLEEQLRPNLDKPLKDLIQSGDVMFITDPNLPSAAIELNVKFTA
jgi:NEDD8-activating enzyme E1